jgi:uncharacterized protein YbaP (TraB family)
VLSAAITQSDVPGDATRYAIVGVLALRGDGIYAEYGSEVFLLGFARGLRKPVISLETPELQIRALRVENRQ